MIITNNKATSARERLHLTRDEILSDDRERERERDEQRLKERAPENCNLQLLETGMVVVCACPFFKDKKYFCSLVSTLPP